MIVELRAAIRLNPDDAQAHSRLGSELAAQGKWEDALVELREATRLQPDDAAARYNLGAILARQGELEEAIAEFRDSIRLNPDDPTVYPYLGIALDEQGNTPEAVVAFREAMRLNPDDGPTHNSLALVLATLPDGPGCDYEEALFHAKRAVALGPQQGNRYTTLALAEYRVGRWSESLAASERSVALEHAGDAFNWFLMAMAHAQKGEKDEARRSFDNAVAWMKEHNPRRLIFRQLWTEAAELVGQPGPDAVEAAFKRGVELTEQGEYDEAIAAFRTAIQIEPGRAVAHYNLGVALFQQGKLDEAIATWRVATRLNPDDATAHSSLGIALATQGRWDEAIAERRAAIRLNPEDALARADLGRALVAQGQWDDAIAEFRAAIRLQPDYANAHYILGICLSTQGKLEEAIAEFREATRLEPTAPGAHNHLAWVLASPSTSPRSDYEEALTHARKAVELAPSDVASVNTLALAEYRSGHWAESVAAAERAMQLRDGDSALDWFILALALWRKGEKDNARMWFDKAARWTKQNAPENADLLQVWTEARDLLDPQGPGANEPGNRPPAG
jgi:tetratricopeptide (TPR) repeat protein